MVISRLPYSTCLFLYFHLLCSRSNLEEHSREMWWLCTKNEITPPSCSLIKSCLTMSSSQQPSETWSSEPASVLNSCSSCFPEGVAMHSRQVHFVLHAPLHQIPPSSTTSTTSPTSGSFKLWHGPGLRAAPKQFRWPHVRPPHMRTHAQPFQVSAISVP